MPRRAFAAILILVSVVFFGISLPVQAQTNQISYIYDELGRLIAVVDPAGETALYTYDSVGNLLSISRRSSSVLSIIKFTPKSGPEGTVVRIYGTAFNGTPSENAVSFNGASATVTSATATQIVTTVPAGATTGAIRITTPGGTVTSSEPFTVTPGVRVNPSLVKLPPGYIMRFTAIVTSVPGNQSVTWSVNGIPGGNASVGTISSDGIYTAPNQPSGSIIRATSVAMPSVFGEARAAVLDPNTGIILASTGVPLSVRYGTAGPDIWGISPSSLTRGETVTLTISGENLRGATALTFIDINGTIDSSIVASDLAVDDKGTSLTARVSVGTSAALGQRVVVVSRSTDHSPTRNLGPNAIEIVPPKT